MTKQFAELIEQSDYWRGSGSVANQSQQKFPYKEWQHFVVFGPSWALMFNLNIDDEPYKISGRDEGRVITIFSADKWQGQVDTCRQPDLGLRNFDACFGRAGMRWRDRAYEIWQEEPGIRLEITLKPVSVPSLSHNIALGHGSYLSWCLVPRLSASGWIETEDGRVSFEQCGAYHDHNWGRFNWGGDFSWEWGCAIPTDPMEPWTLVFARMNSKDRNVTTATSAFLLERGQHIRYFRNAEVSFTTHGYLDKRPAGRIPVAAALLLPDEDYDVPEVTNIAMKRNEEWLTAEVVAGNRGQVLVPSDTNIRSVVRLNEANATVRVRGQCAGREIDFDGPGLLEVVRA